jgi:hypothetical protein
MFNAWLKTEQREGATSSFTFGNICTFLCCEFKIKAVGILESDLEDYGIPNDDAKQYNVVREAIDRPASQRKVIHGGAQLPSYSFVPALFL